MSKFSFDTIENFDEHIDLSIPNYKGLIDHVLNISTYFIKNDSTCYDFGCSTGSLVALLRKRNKTKTTYIGVDKSKAMADQSASTIIADLNTFVPGQHCFSTFIFTLQFMSIEARFKMLKRAYDSLDKGGAILVAEKTFIDDGFLQDLFSFTYYDFKRESFSMDDIIAKQADLRYLMRPISEKENVEMFNEVGFKSIEPFWQSLQFRAWVLIK